MRSTGVVLFFNHGFGGLGEKGLSFGWTFLTKKDGLQNCRQDFSTAIGIDEHCGGIVNTGRICGFKRLFYNRLCC
jgi:hypothetical protein